jgi:serine/threonine-protein kinase
MHVRWLTACNRTLPITHAHAGAGFNNPRGLVIGTDGSLYVGDQGNNRIRKATTGTPGVVTTLAGSSTGAFAAGVGTAASFSAPMGVALDPTGALLYIADYGNNRIRVLTLATLAVTTLAGSSVSGSADGFGTAATFATPRSVAVGACFRR